MKRVLVVGCAGAGKTRFTRQLSEVTGLPIVHLDQYFLQPGWQLPDMRAWSTTVEELIARPIWIMDGNYNSTLVTRLKRCDTVVFLDVPRRICLWRIVLRTVKTFRKNRADVAPGCPERFNLGFFKYVWNYRRNHRPRLTAALEGFRGNKIVLSGSAEVKNCLVELGKNTGSLNYDTPSTTS